MILRAGSLALALASHPAAASEALPTAPGPSLHWQDPATNAAIATDSVEVAEIDVWQRVRHGFKIDDETAPNPLVATHEAWFAARPDNVLRFAERARPYLYHIVEEIERRAMPMEIALLPMIESAFVPTALSPSAASGLWQFIPATGRSYGLRQDPWYDGRRDFTAATSAALDYLGKLYLDFGDWQLALAAYNCGEGCIARAIQKNVALGLPTDYASLSLPAETRHYVPKLLAIKKLISDPGAYGLAIDPLPNQAYFDQVTVHASLDVRSAARLAGISNDEFLALNAAFPRMLIRSDAPVKLLLPVDKTDRFERNFKAGDWDSWQPYDARKGEAVAAIARQHRTTVARLDEHNQLQTKRGRLLHAQTILVPVRDGRHRAPPEDRPPEADNGTLQHVVRSGDTLFGIARRYKLDVSKLFEANPGLDAKLKAGQIVRLPLGDQSGSATAGIRPVRLETRPQTATAPRHITVERGDSLLAIAHRAGISLADLKAWNPSIRKTSLIRPGQRLVVERR